MITVDPVCASCFGPMQWVTVHHGNGRTTRWPLCPVCVTTRHLDLMDQPPETVEPRRLRAVP